MTTRKYTANSTEKMQAIVRHLTTLSCWFEVTPEPDDTYIIEVKQDVAHLAFAKNNEQLIDKARDIFACDDIEIDDNAQVNPTGDGTGHWVQAWVYVRTDEETDE